MAKKAPLSNGKKFFFFFSGVFETFITVGIIFGWTPLLTILVDEGQYDELCPDGKGPCNAQSLKLNLIFTVSVSLFGASFLPAGLFLDRVGPRASRLVGSVIFTIGLILFGSSDSKKFDAFIPSYLLIGLGAPPIFSSFFQWSSLFEKSELFITMLNCAFDGGAIVFFLFQLIYNLGIKRSYLFYGYAIFGILIFIHSALTKDPVKQERGRRRRRYAVEYFTDVKKASWGMPRKQDDFYTFREQLKSIYYVLPTACLVVVATMINYYVGTVSEQLARFNPPQKTLDVFHLLFNTVFPLGTIVWVVPIGWMLSKFSMITSLFVGLTVGVAFGLVTCVTNLYVQFFAFVLLSLFRPLIYSTLSTYITVVFGFRRFGSLYGIMNVINGVFSFGQYLLNYLVFNVFDGDFFHVNFGLTFMIAVMYVFPAFLKIRKRVHDATGDNTYLRVQDKIEKEISRNSMSSMDSNSNRSTIDSSRLDMTTINSMFEDYRREEEEEEEEEGKSTYVPPPITPSVTPLPLPSISSSSSTKKNKLPPSSAPAGSTNNYNPFDEPSNPFDEPPASLPAQSAIITSQQTTTNNAETGDGNGGNPFTENEHEDDGNPFSEPKKPATPPATLKPPKVASPKNRSGDETKVPLLQGGEETDE